MHRDQVRARNAFQFVQGPIQKPADLLALARKLPVMLQTNGLLATWAHLLAKKGSEYEQALTVLTRHLQSLGLAGDTAPEALFNGWVDARNGLSSVELRRRTAEGIEFSVWLKRAAEAVCDTGSGGAAPTPPEEAEVSP
jgi:CRISPR/Cas system CMR-associated protein Cmr5 small subunit